jgi:hypothetical protein
MGDLAGEAADARVPVEGGIADPQRAAGRVGALVAPEPDMVAAIGAAPHLLLESQVLLAAEDVERADGRVGIGAVQDHALGDLEAAGERDRIGRVPAGGRATPGSARRGCRSAPRSAGRPGCHRH